MRYAILLSFLAATFLSLASGYAEDRHDRDGHAESCSDCQAKKTVRHVNRAGAEASVEVTIETTYEGSSTSSQSGTTRRDRGRTERRTDRTRRSGGSQDGHGVHRGDRSRGHSHRSHRSHRHRRGHHGHPHDRSCDHGDDYDDDDDYDDYDDDYYGDDGEEYIEAMSDADFYALIESIEAENFSSGRLRVVRYAVQYHYFTCSQVKQVVEAMTFGSNRVEVAVLLYPEVVDPTNFQRVFSAFTFEGNKREVHERLQL